jgi:hypothetical protein
MSDWTGIFNQAIVPLGQRELSSIGDQTASARRLKAVYLSIADEVLGAHPWKAVMKRALLAPVADEGKPAFGPAFAYALPSNPWCLRAWYVGDRDDVWYDEDCRRWEVEGRQILTDMPAR